MKPVVELFRCPFCGGIATVFDAANPNTMPDCWYAQCKTCRIVTARCYSRDEAVAAWNRRPDWMVRMHARLRDLNRRIKAGEFDKHNASLDGRRTKEHENGK